MEQQIMYHYWLEHSNDSKKPVMTINLSSKAGHAISLIINLLYYSKQADLTWNPIILLKSIDNHL